MQLTPNDRELLDALAGMPNPQSPQAQAKLYQRFGNLTRLWQQVNALLNTEEALAYSPALVNRLRRARARRMPTRSTQRI